MRTPVRHFFFVSSLASATALLLLACVGDAVSTPTPDAGPDATADTSTPDTASSDVTGSDVTGSDVTTDGSVSDAACVTANQGNTVTLPTSGSLLITRPSGPIVAGNYLLTGTYYSCLNCNTVSASAAGGLKITVVGPNVTIERRISLNVSGMAQQNVIDKWTGTFDQLNKQLNVTRACPAPGASLTWFTTLPFTDAGPTNTLEYQSSTELTSKLANDAGVVYPTFVFTRQ